MTDRKNSTEKFKAGSVDLVLVSKRPIAQVANEIGVNEGILGKWVRKYRENQPDRFASEEKAPVPWKEHRQAMAQIAELRQEVGFLRKVSAFFARKQR